MVYDAEKCARNAEADTRNDPGMCLQQTRQWCGIAALYGDAADAGADANDRHPGDRNPPRGAPVYWTGGSSGHGHIALSLGGGKIRSTDAGGSGVVNTVALAWPEQHWGLRYAGWASDINEVTIPGLKSGGGSGGGGKLSGIDISHWQAGLDLADTGADFVIMKATEGATYVDPECDRFYQAAKKAGMKRGVYHFYQGGGAKEADHFLKHVGGYVGDALLALDFETHTSDVKGAKAWLDRVRDRTGVRPVIYMSASVLTANNWSSVEAADYGLWLARWGSGSPGNIAPWTTLALWQYTDSLKRAGQMLDGDYFYGDRAAWDRYAGKTEDNDMPLTDADLNKIRDVVRDEIAAHEKRRLDGDADAYGDRVRNFDENVVIDTKPRPDGKPNNRRNAHRDTVRMAADASEGD